MARGSASFKLSTLTNAIKAARKQGLDVRRIKIDGNKIEIDCGNQTDAEVSSEEGTDQWDAALR